jgi:hypothetical protein
MIAVLLKLAKYDAKRDIEQQASGKSISGSHFLSGYILHLSARKPRTEAKGLSACQRLA